MKQDVILNRTGKRRIAFSGEEIYRGSTKTDTSIRWHVCRVFETKNGYIIGIARLTIMDGERDVYDAHKAKTPQQVITIVNNAVPQLAAEVVTAIAHNKLKESHALETDSDDNVGKESR